MACAGGSASGAVQKEGHDDQEDDSPLGTQHREPEECCPHREDSTPLVVGRSAESPGCSHAGPDPETGEEYQYS